MSPRALTAPPNDRSMWRRMIARCHPDAGGDHDLFIWSTATRDHVIGGELGPEIPRKSEPREQGRGRPRPSTSGASQDRVPFDKSLGFVALKNRALDVAEEVEEPYKTLLFTLLDCVEAWPSDAVLYRQQQQGATYRSLAAIGHRVGMSTFARSRWYRIAESIPLSQRHAGHILSRLQREAA